MPIEMMQSGDLYDAATTKQTRVLDKHRISVNPGPTSSNPGPWLTEVFLAEAFFPDSYKDHNESPEFSEGYLSACLVRESYLFRPRERRLRIPLQTDLDHDDILVPSPTFDDLPSELETRSFCKVVQMDGAILCPHEHAPSFKMVGQPNVLSGPELLKWRAEQFTADDLQFHLQFLEESRREVGLDARADRGSVSDEELEDKEFFDICEAETLLFECPESDERETPRKRRVSARLGSTQTLNADYATWTSNPCEATRNQFVETLFHFLSRKSQLKYEGDTIREMGLTEDFQTDVIMAIMKRLDKHLLNGRIHAYPAAYINRIWTSERIKTLKNLGERRKIEQSLDLPQDTSKESDTDESDLTRIDVQRHKDWSRGAERYSLTEPDPKRVRETRLAAIEKLADDERDLVWMRLRGDKQKEIAVFLNMTQQAVSKRMKRSEAKLAALEAEAA
jgi:DNA-directed RNA polymerase specialized sigma24 family protein